MSEDTNIGIDFSAIRAKLKASDPSIKSKDNSPSPLYLFLMIYTKADRECRINYDEGTKILADWLAPLDYQEDLYPEIADRDFPLPMLLCGYESSEVANIICNFTDSKDPWIVRLAFRVKAKRAVLVTMIKKVLPEL